MTKRHPDRKWWQDAIVYQIYPRSFADANNDGIGDLEGIISRLDHIASLNVDAIWMSPCFPSPQHDHGYDVADYFDINPDYGDLAVFDRLVAGAKERGIRIMLDVVPNHCSIDHAWFRAAVAAGKGSPQRERFYFRDGRGDNGELPPNNWQSIFGGAAWTRITEPDGNPGQWYLHVFDYSQPDMNWEHEDIKKQFDDMLTFWFDRGVEGFRVDAVAVVGKTPGLPDGPDFTGRDDLKVSELATLNPHFQHREEMRPYWARWRALMDRYEAEHPGREIVTVSEAYTPEGPMQLLKYLTPDQFHSSFIFDLMLAPWIPSHVRNAVESNYRVLAENGANFAWTLNNHDTQRSVTRYGRSIADDPKSFTGNNLVHVDAPVDIAVGTRRNRAMIAFASALPGTFYLYQGEETGVPEWLDMPDDRREDPVFRRTAGTEIGRDGCRIPLPWSSDPSTNYGFSGAAGAAAPWLPQPAWWGDFAVDAQENDGSSILSLYRRVLKARDQFDPQHAVEWVLPDDASLVAFRRGPVLVVMNMSKQDVQVPADVLGSAAAFLRTDGGEGATVPANSTVWFR